MMLRCLSCLALLPAACLTLASAAVAQTPQKSTAADQKVVVQGKPETPPAPAAPPDSTTDGTVTVGGQHIAYKAIAGTVTVGYNDNFDSKLGMDGKLLADCRSIVYL